MSVHWKSFLKGFMSSALLFYLACFIILWRCLDYNDLLNNAVPQTLSRLTPPIDYFEEFVDKEDHYDRFKLMLCVNYHKAVADHFAFQQAEAYGMMGFCYERLSQIPQATAAYQRSISINPDYFWPYFDLGVIDYNEGKYQQAIEYFKQALDLDPVKTIVLLSRSKVYNDVLLSKLNGAYDYIQGLKQGRMEAYMLMMSCLDKSGSAKNFKPRVTFF